MTPHPHTASRYTEPFEKRSYIFSPIFRRLFTYSAEQIKASSRSWIHAWQHFQTVSHVSTERHSDFFLTELQTDHVIKKKVDPIIFQQFQR